MADEADNSADEDIDWEAEGKKFRKEMPLKRAEREKKRRDYANSKEGKAARKAKIEAARKSFKELRKQLIERRKKIREKIQKWRNATPEERKVMKEKMMKEWKERVGDKTKQKERQQRMVRWVKKFMKTVHPKKHHQFKFLAGFYKAYPFFSIYDKDKNGKIYEDEWLDVILNKKKGYTTYEEMYGWFKKNAKAICHDPRPRAHDSDTSGSDSTESDWDGFMGPLSQFWFQLDTNKDG